MYEDFFSLQRRPFSVTPDPGCWFHEGPYQAALDELVVCAEQGQGISILVAPAGTGKTLVCERLVRELRDRFATVLLRHATFTTRRALLQTILCELDRPFHKTTDQELRLGVSAVLKELHQADSALALVVDEAHQLPDGVLEELRILADHATDGRPLVRLILAGQFSLEDKLALPGAQALNQRIRAQVVLPTLSHAESANYIDYRITWAGGRTDEVFSPESLDLMCRAADGVPRCVNQLCDQALLSALVKEERPVSAQTVRDALADLSRLPLPWNPVPISVRDDAQPGLSEGPASLECPPDEAEDLQPLGETTELLPLLDAETPLDLEVRLSEEPDFTEIETVPSDEPDSTVYRLSSRLDDWADEGADGAVFADATPPQWSSIDESIAIEADEELSSDGFEEEVVVDRYASLDAGLELPAAPPAETAADPEPISVSAALNQWSSLWTQPAATHQLTERLAAIQQVLDAVAEAGSESLPALPAIEANPSDHGATNDETSEEQLEAAVLDICEETRQRLTAETDHPAPVEPTLPSSCSDSANEAVFEFGADLSTADHAVTATPPPDRRSCRNLFTRLRRKQQGRE